MCRPVSIRLHQMSAKALVRKSPYPCQGEGRGFESGRPLQIVLTQDPGPCSQDTSEHGLFYAFRAGRAGRESFGRPGSGPGREGERGLCVASRDDARGRALKSSNRARSGRRLSGVEPAVADRDAGVAFFLVRSLPALPGAPRRGLSARVTRGRAGCGPRLRVST